MFKLNSAEEIIKKTKPHSAAFLSSPLFWVGILFLSLGSIEIFLLSLPFVEIVTGCAGGLLIAVSYLRRVTAYSLIFTDHRVVSSYSFIRKAYHEIYYDRIIAVKMIQGLFGKVGGYGDVWFYGYQNEWVVGRMRGVALGDWEIVANKAWKAVRNL